MDRWDPFNIVPAVAEQYDELAASICCFLSMNSSEEQIAGYLADAEIRVMQWPPPDMRDLHTRVERLVDEWKRIGP